RRSASTAREPPISPATMRSPSAVPGIQRMTKNGLPITLASRQRKSGSGTVTPAAWTSRCTANSLTRSELIESDVAASVRSTSFCRPAKAPPAIAATSSQFSCTAPPESGLSSTISVARAPAASHRKRASRSRVAASSSVMLSLLDGAHRMPAIDRQHRAGDIGAGIRREQQQGTVEILELAGASERDAAGQGLAGLAGKKLAVHVGREISRCDGVDGDAAPRELDRHGAGEMDEPGFRRRVARHVPHRAQSEQRRDIDDAPLMRRLDPDFGHLARHEPGPLEVGVDDAIPVLLAVLEHGLRDGDAGIVDENVERPQRRPRRGDGVAHAPDIADIARDAGDAATLCGDLACRRLEPIGMTRGERDRRAGARQHAGEMLPEPARCPGDEGDAAREVEHRHVGLPLAAALFLRHPCPHIVRRQAGAPAVASSVAKGNAAMHIDIVSDVICPWCFIGKRRLEKALSLRPDLAVDVTWRPFQLNPDMPAEGMERKAYIAAKFGGGGQAERNYANVAAVGAGVGIPFAFDRIRRTPNTRDAHRLIRWAAAQALADPVVEG